MFKTRVITSLVLAPCLIALLFWSPAKILYAVFFSVLLVAAYEWRKLIPRKNFLITTFFGILYVVSILSVNYFRPDWFIYFSWIWAPIIFFVLIYPKGTVFWSNRFIILGMSILVSCLFSYAMQHIYSLALGKPLLVYFFFIVWSADIGAYIFGKLWGSNKLIPNVSPSKTWEGVLGGGLFVAVVAMLGGTYLNPISISKWYLLSYICFVVSLFGDLFISMLKRNCGLKDTGDILPGHGGVLDRLDSLISTAPIYYIGLNLFNLGFY